MSLFSYEPDRYIQILPYTDLGESKDYTAKREEAKAYLGRKWILYREKSKTQTKVRRIK